MVMLWFALNALFFFAVNKGPNVNLGGVGKGQFVGPASLQKSVGDSCALEDFAGDFPEGCFIGDAPEQFKSRYV